MLHRNKLDKLSKKSTPIEKGAITKGSNYKVEVWHHMVRIVPIERRSSKLATAKELTISGRAKNVKERAFSSGKWDRRITGFVLSPLSYPT